VPRVWRVYLLACKRFLVVTDRANLTHLLRQASDKITDRQVPRVERLMPFTRCIRILYRKVSLNKADAVSRRPDYFSIRAISACACQLSCLLSSAMEI